MEVPTTAKKATYTVTTAEGKVEKRQSANPYTHVLLGRRDYVVARDQAHKWRPQHEANFNYLTRVAARQHIHADTPEYIAKAQAAIAGYANAAQYATAKIEAAIAEIGDGDAGPEVALRWSRSQALASKAIGEFDPWFTGLRVVAVEVR